VQRAVAEDTGDAMPRYELKVRLLPADRRVETQGTVWLPKSVSPQDSLLLVLNDTMRGFRVEVLKPTASAGEAKPEKKEAERVSNEKNQDSPETRYPIGPAALKNIRLEEGIAAV
jgi:hypothetical protein